MNQTERKIAEELQGVIKKTNVSKDNYAICSGVVSSVNTDDYTCTVVLNINVADNATEGVFVNAALEVTEGVIMIPAVNSVVWVAVIDGGGNKGVVKCSVLDKMLVKVGGKWLMVSNDLVALNGDSYGGLVQVMPLTDALDGIQTDINQLKTILHGIVTAMSGLASSAPSTPVVNAALASLFGPLTPYSTNYLTVTNQVDLENTNVKHG